MWADLGSTDILSTRFQRDAPELALDCAGAAMDDENPLSWTRSFSDVYWGHREICDGGAGSLYLEPPPHSQWRPSLPRVRRKALGSDLGLASPSDDWDGAFTLGNVPGEWRPLGPPAPISP